MLMQQFIVRLLLTLAIATISAPSLASRGATGCARHDRRFTEAALAVALIATAAALMIRRSRIGWDDPRDP